VLRPAKTPGVDYVGFKVASEADLDAFARRIEAAETKVEEVPAGEQPWLGRRLSLVVPTGHRVELFAEMALSEDEPKRVCSIDKIGKAIFILSARVERAVYECRYLMP
jgi:catechol 2,3-dioxygenase